MGTFTRFLEENGENPHEGKAETFSREQIDLFLRSPTDQFFVHKLALLIGLSGALRTKELTNLTFEDIHLKDDHLAITTIRTKTHKFIISFEFQTNKLSSHFF